MRTASTLALLLLSGCFISDATVDARTDADGDGFFNAASGGDDCDDNDPDVNPGVAEVFYDDIDNDCDGIDDDDDLDGDGAPLGIDCDDTDPAFGPDAEDIWYDGIDHDCAGNDDFDQDGDGVRREGDQQPGQDADCNDNNPEVFGPEVTCDGIDNDCDITTPDSIDDDGDGVGHCEDCNDQDALVYPGAEERCNALDDDCDDVINNGIEFYDVYEDGDNDGHGNPLAPSLNVCDTPPGYVESDDDCDDRRTGVSPSALELCDGIDNDCDTVPDNGLAVDLYFPDADGDGFGNDSDPTLGQPSCVVLENFSAIGGDCNDDIDAGGSTQFPGNPELCDGIDNDCDTSVDNGLFVDADGDGFGDPVIVECTLAPDGVAFVRNSEDCDDESEDIRPDVPDVCDGLDNDCDGTIDNDFALGTFFQDVDGDGFGDDTTAEPLCAPRTGMVAVGGDCDDMEPTVRPFQAETCDGLDNNCNGENDEGLVVDTYFIDLDEDRFGDPATGIVSCVPLQGRVIDGGDCDDDNPDIRPFATEVCDGLDNDCSGEADSGLVFVDYFVDLDADGFGDELDDVVNACAAPSGRVPMGGDCDDTNAAVKPGQNEICNNLDDDCDGEADNGIDFVDYYTDADQDGAGDPMSDAVTSCFVIAGAAITNDDCDDANPLRSPTLDEICDGIDNDCDQMPDDGLVTDAYWPDSDGDGFGDDTAEVQSCVALANHVTNGNDCDDNRSDIRPGATEFCADGLDTNCDGDATDLEPGSIGLAPVYVDEDRDGHGVPWSAPEDEEFACEVTTNDRSFDNIDCDDDDFQKWRTGLHSLGESPSREQITAAMNESCTGSTITFDGPVVMDESLNFGDGEETQVGVTLLGGDNASITLDVPDGVGPTDMLVILAAHDLTIENIDFNGCPPEDECAMGRFQTTSEAFTVASGGTTRSTFRNVAFRNFHQEDRTGFFVNSRSLDITFEDVLFEDFETTDNIMNPELRDTSDGLVIYTRGTSTKPGMIGSELRFTRAHFRNIMANEPNHSALISDASTAFGGATGNIQRPFRVTVEDSMVEGTNSALLRMAERSSFTLFPDQAGTTIDNVLVVNSSANFVLDTVGAGGTFFAAHPDRTLTVDGLTILNSTGGSIRGHAATTVRNSVLLSMGGESGSFANDVNCLSDNPGSICVQSPAAADLFVDPTLVDGLPVDITVDPTSLPMGVSAPIGFVP